MYMPCLPSFPFLCTLSLYLPSSLPTPISLCLQPLSYLSLPPTSPSFRLSPSPFFTYLFMDPVFIDSLDLGKESQMFGACEVIIEDVMLWTHPSLFPDLLHVHRITHILLRQIHSENLAFFMVYPVYNGAVKVYLTSTCICNIHPTTFALSIQPGICAPSSHYCWMARNEWVSRA